MLEFKGYRGKVEYIGDARIFHGEVLGIRDVITFQGTTADEIEQAFRESVDDYLDFCQDRGEEPDKPYSGKFVLRLTEDLHREVSDLARLRDDSINNVVCEAVARYVAKEMGGE